MSQKIEEQFVRGRRNGSGLPSSPFYLAFMEDRGIKRKRGREKEREGERRGREREREREREERRGEKDGTEGKE